MIGPFRVKNGVTALLITVQLVHTVGWFRWMFGFEDRKNRRGAGKNGRSEFQRLDPLEEHIPAQKKCCDIDDLGEEFVAHPAIDPHTR
jgi:hypothetical protein